MKEIFRLDSCELIKFNEFFFKRQPVLIENLFINQVISEACDLKSAKEIFNEIKFETIDDYQAKVINEESFNAQGEYLSFQHCVDYIKKNKESKLCVRNYLPLDKIDSIFKTPSHCLVRQNSEITHNLFLANNGNITHLHFDNDHRSILIYQVFGQKRIILIPENQSKKVCPVLNQSWVNIENFSESEKRNFIEYADGYDFILNPGEALLVPMMMWHYVEYIGISMSINFRFGRSFYNDFFYRHVHSDMYLQNIATKFNGLNPEPYLSYFNLIKNEVDKKSDNPISKYKKMNNIFKDIYREICTDALQKEYFVMENDFLIENNKAILNMASQCYEIKNESIISSMQLK